MIRDYAPWWAKLAAKLVLARLPVPYRVWRRLGVFVHGAMLDVEFARRTFSEHFGRVRSWLPPSFSVLELGPGDSLATAVIAAEQGASSTWLVDASPDAGFDLAHYRALLGGTPWAAEGGTMLDVLARVNARYETAGLASLRQVPEGSVDFVFSQAVLEHVRRDEFDRTVDELFRLQAPGGVASHHVDLQDHLAYSLNSLRFPARVWESALFRSSGFYTNRLRDSEILRSFEKAGYRVVDVDRDRWPALPLSRRRLHADFRHFTDEELRVRRMDILLCKAP
jgi:hypothetical protein